MAAETRTRPSSSRWFVVVLLSLLLFVPFVPTNAAVAPNQNGGSGGGYFNTQVMWRVLERIEDFTSIPVHAAARAEKMRKLGVFFPHQLQGQERRVTLPFLFAEVPYTLYYGLEDGTFLIISTDGQASYREPGESYRVGGDSDEQLMTDRDVFLQSHFYQQCVDRTTGAVQNCTMNTAGHPYVNCIDDCVLKPCSTQPKDCSQFSGRELSDCLVGIYKNTTYFCPRYTIESVSEEEAKAGTIGYVPRTYSCLNSQAQLEEGRFQRALHLDGSCYFGDGVTLVNRSHIRGQYQYCQTNAHQNQTGFQRQSCAGVFRGGFRSRDYDPRFRPWYILSKRLQANSWSAPYPFYTTLDMGITYALPMHKDTVLEDAPAKEFYGVWGVDISLSLITDFVTTQYNQTSMWVLVLDTSPPYYVLAASTGSPAARKVLAEEPTRPCPPNDPTDVDCDVVRVSIAELGGGGDPQGDQIVRRSFQAYQEAGFPTDTSELIGFKTSDNVGSQAFVTQGKVYEQEGSNNLQWYVLVSMPLARSANDAVLPGTAAFVIISALATMGVVGCLLLFLIIFQKRKERAFINGDWRFTSLFILGCSALNLSTYTLLGDNTDALCRLRMWAFNLLFAIALSPLIVKVWRMHKMVTASYKMERIKISHWQAFSYTFPIPFLEMALLTVFTIVDPPSQVETLQLDDDSGVSVLSCGMESSAFYVAQSFYHGILVLTGCVLAYKSRHLDPAYGEAKQLGFAMYNIAFTYIIIGTILHVTEIDQIGRVVLQAIGILWGTVFSALAFVLPRLIEVQSQKKRATHEMKATIQGFLHQTSDWESRISTRFGRATKLGPRMQPREAPEFERASLPNPKPGDAAELRGATLPSDTTHGRLQSSSEPSFRIRQGAPPPNHECQPLPPLPAINNKKRLVRSLSWTKESSRDLNQSFAEDSWKVHNRQD